MKKQFKKHKFKHLPESVVAGRGSDMPHSVVYPGSSGRSSSAGVSSLTNGRDFSYVSIDLRRILILAGLLVMTELVLWYLLTNTGVGPMVYRLINP